MEHQSRTTTGNIFLDHLPLAAVNDIIRFSKPTKLVVRAPIYGLGQTVTDVFFPIDGVISNVCKMEDGSQIEVGLTGREGMTGVPLGFTSAPSTLDVYVQVTGHALRLSFADLVSVVTPVAMGPFWAYAESLTGTLSQYAACNRLHTLDERFARWLVMAHDRISGDNIALTHEFLGLMLGVRRAGVSLAAKTFQNAGLIDYRHGQITIRDRASLQAVACECYDRVEDRFTTLMGYSIRKYRTTDKPSSGDVSA